MAKWKRNYAAEGMSPSGVSVYSAALGDFLALRVNGNDRDGWRAYVNGDLLGLAGHDTLDAAKRAAEETARTYLTNALKDLDESE